LGHGTLLILKMFLPILCLCVPGGLKYSALIASNLVSAFVPFLPLERRHVRKCVMDDVESKQLEFTDAQVNAIVDELEYSPESTPLFSVPGCKRVTEKVNLYMSERFHREREL
jgi:hypothetical protein